MRTHEVKKQMDMIWESYVMGEPVKEEDHRGHGHDCKKVHPDQSHDEWKKKDKKEEKVEEGEHWSQMPANQALQNFKKVILNLEPAGDQREAYRDAVDAKIDTKVLHSIIIKAVKDELLSNEEAQFITGGGGFDEEGDLSHHDTGIEVEGGGSFADSNPLPGADDGPRELDSPEEGEDENFWEPEKEQYNKTKQFIDWLTSSHNQAARKYHDAFNDPSANAMDLGREIYGNMSPELQREYDQDVLIDVIEDKIGEAGMRPKESNIEPFSQYFNEG